MHTNFNTEIVLYTTTDQPTDKEILDVLFDVRMGNPSLGLERVHNQIKSRHPGWNLSIKVRIAKIYDSFGVMIPNNAETAQNAKRHGVTASGRNPCPFALHIAVAIELCSGALWNIRLECSMRFRFIEILRESLYSDDWRLE